MALNPDPYKGKYLEGYVVTLSREGVHVVLWPKGWGDTLRPWQWHPLPEGFEPVASEASADKKARELIQEHGPVWVWKVYYSHKNFRLYEPRNHWSNEPPSWKVNPASEPVDLIADLADKCWAEAVEKLDKEQLRMFAGGIWERWHRYNEGADLSRDLKGGLGREVKAGKVDAKPGG